MAVDNGPEVVYHDLINSDETLSLVISKLENEVDLDDLGGADAVGERLFGEKNINLDDEIIEKTLIKILSDFAIFRQFPRN